MLANRPSLPNDSIAPARPKTALVLGAGGVRGCAHAGAIAVLREAGIQIDLVVGASVGAIFGLGVAAGLPTEDIVSGPRDNRPLDLLRFYLSGLRAGPTNRVARMMLEAAEGKTFDDLEIPFAVTATDMETGHPAIINSGPVLQAVEASIALPLIARPVRIGDRCYVDGGLLNTIPVAAARALGAERVIAVCLGFNYHAPHFLRKRPWTQPILERLGRQQTPVTGTLADQIRFACRFFAATYEPPPPSQDADISIWPDLGSRNPNSIFGAQICLAQGYQAAREAIVSMEL